MTSALWTSDELKKWAVAADGCLRRTLPKGIAGISIDSRSLQKNEAFFAIKGERTDGHNYASAAVEKGAALLVIDKAHEKLADKIKVPCLIVPDVLKALEKLGDEARVRLKPQAKVIAVTGSVGKTTVKEMIAQILRAFGAVHNNPASFNNQWGVPLTLARMPRNTDYAIFEIGMNHAGEIAPLAKLVRPHLALITCITNAHMENFSSLAEIAAAKAEIFSGLVEKGVILLNRDDSQYQFLWDKGVKSRKFIIQSFGRSPEAKYQIVTDSEKQLADGQGQEFTMKAPFGEEVFALKAQGSHMVENACAAIAVVSEVFVRPTYQAEKGKAVINYDDNSDIKPDLTRIREALANFTALNGRGARYKLALPKQAGQQSGNWFFIDESYNANPFSMKAALRLLAEMKPFAGGRRIAVLGDMLELGQTAQKEHEELAAEILAADINSIFLVGEKMCFLQGELQRRNISCNYRVKAEGLAADLLNEIQNGDVVMLKASHSIGFDKIAEKILAECSPLSQQKTQKA